MVCMALSDDDDGYKDDDDDDCDSADHDVMIRLLAY